MQSVDELTALDAVKLGLFQALALIPGTSRSGATIIGGLLCGLSRRTAAEFSFFAALPVLLAATAFEIYKARAEFATADVEPLIVSCVVSFISASAGHQVPAALREQAFVRRRSRGTASCSAP